MYILCHFEFILFLLSLKKAADESPFLLNDYGEGFSLINNTACRRGFSVHSDRLKKEM